MPFNPNRFRESYEKISGKAADENLIETLNSFGSLTSPKQKSSHIKTLLEDLTEREQEAVTCQIMLECGRKCIGASTIQKAKKLFANSTDMTEFLSKMNDNHIGGGRLTLDGSNISGGYDTCYCGTVSKANQLIPITYCYCSAGWYQRLFESVLTDAVQVEIIQSIASGADSCEFRIKIGTEIPVQ